MHHTKMSDHAKMSAAAQRPAVLQDAFAVTGGGIDPAGSSTGGGGLGNAWMIKPIVVEGQSFGDIYIGSCLCKQFLGKNFKMVEHINLRNKKVHELMQALSKEDDPNGEMELTDGTLNMPKRELFNRLPKIITIDVATASMVASVKMLPSWRTRGVLQLEITQPNLDLLLDEPPAEPAPWLPTLDHANVYWIASRNQARCYYLGQ